MHDLEVGWTVQLPGDEGMTGVISHPALQVSWPETIMVDLADTTGQTWTGERMPFAWTTLKPIARGPRDRSFWYPQI